MQLVIDISQEELEMIKLKLNSPIGGVISQAELIILNGAPLPKGQWIFSHHNGFGRRIFICSNCKFNGDTYGYKYCPNCGVKMVVENDNGKTESNS